MDEGKGETHIQRQIQTQHITLPEQSLKINILSRALFLELLTQPRPIMILHLHPEHPRPPRHRPPDPPHPQDPQHLALRVVPQRGVRAPLELARAEGGHGDGEVAQRAEDEEDGDVGGGVVYGGGDVGDEDVAGGAGGYVDLVVAGAWWFPLGCLGSNFVRGRGWDGWCEMAKEGRERGRRTIMADEPQTLRQLLDELLVDEPRHLGRVKGPVRGPHAVQRPGAAFGDELVAVARGGHDDLRRLGDGGP